MGKIEAVRFMDTAFRRMAERPYFEEISSRIDSLQGLEKGMVRIRFQSPMF